MKILVVDDEHVIRMGIRTVIQRYEKGWVVVGEASDGIDALEQIESCTPPDVIITDIRMPRMDGIELTKQLGERYPDMLAIIISGHAEFDFAQEAIRMGAMDYILKPTKPETLIEVLYKAQKIIDIREEKRQEEEKLHLELELLRRELRTKQAGADAGSIDDKKEGQNCRKIIGAAIDYIKQNYALNLTLRHMGDVVCMNHSYFCNLFKQETGKSFSEYLTEIRIEKAKEFLITRVELRSYEIADMVGYRDPKYFCYIFKKLTGVTPTEFRDKS